MCNVAKPLQGKAPFFSLLCFIGHEIRSQCARWQKQTEYELIIRYESCKQGCCHEIKDWVSTTKKLFMQYSARSTTLPRKRPKWVSTRLRYLFFFLLLFFFYRKRKKNIGENNRTFFSSKINISGNSSLPLLPLLKVTTNLRVHSQHSKAFTIVLFMLIYYWSSELCLHYNG